jgi:hypothetical protein
MKQLLLQILLCHLMGKIKINKKEKESLKRLLIITIKLGNYTVSLLKVGYFTLSWTNILLRSSDKQKILLMQEKSGLSSLKIVWTRREEEDLWIIYQICTQEKRKIKFLSSFHHLHLLLSSLKALHGNFLIKYSILDNLL